MLLIDERGEVTMENEIIKQLLEKVFEGGGFLWGFLSGSLVMLIFRKTVVRFLVLKVLKWKNDKKKDK